MGNFKEDIAKCQALVLDVDGVFTDGGITPTCDGDFIRTYNCKDGYAIAYAVKLGYKVCIISGGRGENLRYRMNMLHIEDLYLDCTDKISAIKEFCEKYGFDRENLIYMGDDIPDLECMEFVGMPVAPNDACMEVIETARYVSEYGGGKGCVRDIVEQWLRSKGDWAKSRKGVAMGIPSR